MHREVQQWLLSATEVPWEQAVVYEVGSANWNGQAKDVCIGWRRWLGFDIVDTDGVDVVGDAVKVLPAFPLCDVMVSTEVLEHVADWRELVAAMCRQIRNDGWLVLTCAGTGRPVHSADGAAHLKPGEHYANVSLAEVREVCAEHAVTMIRGEEGPPGDTRFIGLKVVRDGEPNH